MAVAGNIYSSVYVSGTTTPALPSTVLPANAYLVVSWTASTTNTSATIADSAGGTWVTAIAYNSTGTATQTWLRTTPGTGAAITVTVTAVGSAGRHVLAGTYFTGASGSISSATTATGTTTFPTLTTPTSTAIGDMYYVANHSTSSAGTFTTTTASTGFTKGANAQSTLNPYHFVLAQYQSAASIGTVSVSALGFSGTSPSSTKTNSFVVYQAAPAINFIGWGMPL